MKLSSLFGLGVKDPCRCSNFLGLEFTILVTVGTLRASRTKTMMMTAMMIMMMMVTTMIICSFGDRAKSRRSQSLQSEGKRGGASERTHSFLSCLHHTRGVTGWEISKTRQSLDMDIWLNNLLEQPSGIPSFAS